MAQGVRPHTGLAARATGHIGFAPIVSGWAVGLSAWP